MKKLIILLLVIIVLLVTAYFSIGNNNKEKYIDLGDEITTAIQNASISKLTSTTPKLNTIKNNMTITNTSLNDIISSQTTALNNITQTVSSDISDLTNINNKLDVSIKKVKKLINGTVILVNEKFENFENQSQQNNQNQYNFNKSNNMNNKDKLTNYFYNYVPPKQNVYEGFFDWKDEWNRKVNEIGLSLQPSSVIKDGNYQDELPIIYKPDMKKNMNETAAKIISLASTNNEQELLKSWRRNLRGEN